MKTNNTLHIEVWSDVVCPFCYIGKRNLEKALSNFPHQNTISVEWKSYQLDPTFEQDPDQKLNLVASLAKKYNRPVAVIEESQKNIVRAAKEVGLHFDFDKAVTFNTFQAHRVIQKAKEIGLGDQAEETFFSAYFEQGEDLGNRAVLKNESVDRIGLTEQQFEDALSDQRYANKVLDDIKEAYQIGVQGVPFFVFDRKYAVSGAQPVAAFSETLQTAYDAWMRNQSTSITTVAQGPSCDLDGNCR
ncbi:MULTISPECIES: DsbA family oxidoreductase [Chitinophagaceae]